MSKSIIWSPLSEKDLEQILGYLKTNWNLMVDNQFINITEQSINQIAKNPKQYPLINRKLRIRKVVLTKHNSLFYRESKNHIDILRIYDTRQDPYKLKFK